MADGTVKQEIKIYYKFIGFVDESCVCSRLISPSVSSWHKQDNTLMHQSPGHIQRRTLYELSAKNDRLRKYGYDGFWAWHGAECGG